MVAEVASDSKAEDSGVRPGDVIVKINDRDVSDAKGLQGLLQGSSQWTVVLRRNKQLLSFSVRG